MKNSDQPTAHQAFLGRGFGFPPRFTKAGGDVETVENAEDIEQSLRILLGTARGERVLRESFGCDLSDLLFEEADRWLVSRIQQTIKDAITENEPRIVVDRIEVNGDDRYGGRFDVHIMYTVRATNSRFNMVFPFYLTEANSTGP